MYLPRPLRQLYDGWMIGSEALGRIMSWILLTILWLTLFGVYALVIKAVALFRPVRDPATYWVAIEREHGDGMLHPF